MMPSAPQDTQECQLVCLQNMTTHVNLAMQGKKLTSSWKAGPPSRRCAVEHRLAGQEHLRWAQPALGRLAACTRSGPKRRLGCGVGMLQRRWCSLVGGLTAYININLILQFPLAKTGFVSLLQAVSLIETRMATLLTAVLILRKQHAREMTGGYIG